jgi:hypothetical protein
VSATDPVVSVPKPRGVVWPGAAALVPVVGSLMMFGVPSPLGELQPVRPPLPAVVPVVPLGTPPEVLG